MCDHYGSEFNEVIARSARSSAKVIVPLVMEALRPTSVVDVGCGTGAWLAAFARRGVGRIVGLDGDWVDSTALEIPRDCFRACDLSRPLIVEPRFDLAVCLEVAEHLPAESASTLVGSLATLAPAILFSAAIPGQGGQHHVNEQWPEYWAQRFRARGYRAVDCIRPRVWDDPAVATFYAQNALLYLSRECFAAHSLMREPHERPSPLALVHPGLLVEKQSAAREWLDRLAGAAAGLAAAVPPGARLLMLDGGLTAGVLTAGFETSPLPEREGAYAGPPADGAGLIDEVNERLRDGVRHLAVAWPAFWWLTHYADFAAYLRASHRQILANDSVVVFALGSPPVQAAVPGRSRRERMVVGGGEGRL